MYIVNLDLKCGGTKVLLLIIYGHLKNIHFYVALNRMNSHCVIITYMIDKRVLPVEYNS